MAEHELGSDHISQSSESNADSSVNTLFTQVRTTLKDLRIRFSSGDISLNDLLTISKITDKSGESPFYSVLSQLGILTSSDTELSEKVSDLQIEILDVIADLTAEAFQLKLNEVKLRLRMEKPTKKKRKELEKALAVVAQDLYVYRRLLSKADRQTQYVDAVFALQDEIKAEELSSMGGQEEVPQEESPQEAPESQVPSVPIVSEPIAQPVEPPVDSVEQQVSQPEKTAESEITEEINSFDSFLSALESKANESDFDPFSEYSGFQNALVALETTSEDFYQIVIGLLEESSRPSEKRKGVQLRRKYESEISNLKAKLESKSKSAILTVDKKWKENPKYEQQFPQLIELKKIYESTPDIGALNAKRAEILTLLEDFSEKMDDSNVSQLEKQTLINTYVKDIFNMLLKPFYEVSDEVNDFRLDGGVTNRTTLQLDDLQERFNLQYRWILSSRFKSYFGDLFPTELERVLKDGEQTNQFDGLLSEIREEQLDTFGYEDLARWCKRLNADPFGYQEARTGNQEPYKALVISKVKERLFAPNPEDTPWQNHERERWFVWLALKFMNDKMQNASESATATKTAKRMYENQEETVLQNEMRNHSITREIIIKNTTADPEYGKYFTDLIKALKVKAALKGPPKHASGLPEPEAAMNRLADMSPKQLRINNPIMTKEGQIAYVDGKFYAFSDAVKYETLINEVNGRAVMSSYFGSIKRPQGISDESAKMALEMAELVYPNFTILDESFYELQASTMTRGHNTQEDDFGSIHKPTTTAVHRAYRYSEERCDALAMWTPYKITDHPEEDHAGGGHHKYHHELMPKNYVLSEGVTQRLLNSLHGHTLHQRVFYDTNRVFGKIDFPGFLEQVFPGASALFTMHEKESIWIPNPKLKGKTKKELTENDMTEILVDRDGNQLAQSNSQGEIFSSDGKTKLAKFKDSSGRITDPSLINKIAEEQNTNPDQRTKSQGYIELFTGRDKGQTVRLGDERAKLPLPNGGTVPVTGYIDDVAKYFLAFGGMKKVNKLVFSKIPGGLSFENIIDKSSTDKGMLHELMSAFGVVKMYPSFALDNLATPYLGMYVLKLVQFFKPSSPQERIALVAAMVDQLTRTGYYGGLSAISKSVDEVINKLLITTPEPDPALVRSVGESYDEGDALTSSPWGRFTINRWVNSDAPVKRSVYPRTTIWRYMEAREEELKKYITEVWHEEIGSKIPVPPLGDNFGVGAKMRAWEWNMNRNNEVITPQMRHLIDASRNEATIPSFLNLKSEFEVEDKKAKEEHK